MKDPKGHGSEKRNYMRGSKALSASHALGGGLKASETYHPEAVDKAIASSNRFGRKIGGKEAARIHAVLKGWRG